MIYKSYLVEKNLNLLNTSLCLFFGENLGLKNDFKNKNYSKLTHSLLFLGALALFIVGMEEVSYFQRVIQFETPESFVGNMQGEFNLHNFNT